MQHSLGSGKIDGRRVALRDKFAQAFSHGGLQHPEVVLPLQLLHEPTLTGVGVRDPATELPDSVSGALRCRLLTVACSTATRSSRSGPNSLSTKKSSTASTSASWRA